MAWASSGACTEAHLACWTDCWPFRSSSRKDKHVLHVMLIVDPALVLSAVLFTPQMEATQHSGFEAQNPALYLSLRGSIQLAAWHAGGCAQKALHDPRSAHAQQGLHSAVVACPLLSSMHLSRQWCYA